MRKTSIALLLFCLAAPLAAQMRQRVVRSTPGGVVNGPWSIEMVSTGGFSGGGFGDIRISSDGTLVVGHFVTNGKTCEFLLPPGEVATLFQAVQSLRANLWVASYFPADSRGLCCDLIFLTITVTRTEEDRGSRTPVLVRYRTEMISAEVDIPGDLAGLRELLTGYPDGYLNRYQRLCSTP